MSLTERRVRFTRPSVTLEAHSLGREQLPSSRVEAVIFIVISPAQILLGAEGSQPPEKTGYP